jgi:hypothetical protein
VTCLTDSARGAGSGLARQQIAASAKPNASAERVILSILCGDR